MERERGIERSGRVERVDGLFTITVKQVVKKKKAWGVGKDFF